MAWELRKRDPCVRTYAITTETRVNIEMNLAMIVCEIHKPLGNLREKSFWEIWSSEEARRLRQSIARKDCYCTTEVFLWSSIVYQPHRLLQAMLRGKVWRKPKPIMQRQIS